jgi:hypothetical protein
MSKTAIKPQNLPEALVWYYIIGTYVIYYMGAQYLFAPMLGTFLTIYLIVRLWWQDEQTPPQERVTVPFASWLWLGAILVIEFSLIMGHLHFNLGVDQIVKTTMNRWFRTWFLFPMFLLAGSLPIRPQLIYRAICILCFQSLFFILLGAAGIAAGIPDDLEYSSPLKIFGGGDFYDVKILGYTTSYDGESRLQLFTPWAPALGLLGNIYFWFAWCETDKKWRWLGLLGATAMVVSSVSRAGIIFLPLVPCLIWLMLNVTRPWVQMLAGFTCFLAGLFGSTLLSAIETLTSNLNSYRAGSSRVRETLQRMAIEKWQKSPIWGYGTISPKGPAVTGHLPVGTHHTWNSLLYTHGIVGCTALAIAVIWSFLELLIKAHRSPIARVGLSVILILILFSFSENLDSMTYIFWPGLLILGISFKETETQDYLFSIYETDPDRKYRQTVRH